MTSDGLKVLVTAKCLNMILRVKAVTSVFLVSCFDFSFSFSISLVN